MFRAIGNELLIMHIKLIRMHWANTFASLLCIWLSVFVGSLVQAAESEVFSNPAVSARLISAEDGVAPSASSVSAGLVLEYAEGWKGYWRTPGEVGLAPELDWSKSDNLASAEILWPAPERFEAFGIENFGYAGTVVLPIRILLEHAGQPIKLRSKVMLLTCSDVCVPHNFELVLDLANGTEIDQISADKIAAFAARVPVTPAESNIEVTSVSLDARASALFVTAKSAQPFQAVDVFPEFGPLVTFGKPEVRANQDRSTVWAKIPVIAWSDDHLDPVVTLTDGMRAVTTPVVLGVDIPAPPDGFGATQSSLSELGLIIVMASLGGLILNLMPCVLPVLSIKFSSVINASGQSKKTIRNGFLFSALGVLSFMWMLAAVILALRLVGISVGWGIQFQNPVFVTFMFIVIASFSANLFGLFEISLPSAMQDRLNRGSHQSQYVKDFGTGFLAAVLATPCSAPFLGTAITFALVGGPIDVLAVFTALGIGLAMPYLLIAARPALVAHLPRPGRWMLFVRTSLGFLLLMTAVWLLFLLVRLSGWQATALVAFCTVTLIAVLTIDWSRKVHRYGLAAASVLFSLVAVSSLTSTRSSVDFPISTHWQDFQPREIARHVSEGRTVFVDVTADWCLTCKANKVLVLDRKPVSDELSADTVIAMQADWTRPDDNIARFLERHGRFGIPFNIVYGPGAPAGVSMSELLTEQDVLEALATASLGK